MNLTSINDSDSVVLEEIKEILSRHNKLDKFGIAVLHHHFDLDDKEILVERTNLKTRTSISSPEKFEVQKHKDLIGTILNLKTGKFMQFCSPCSH